MENLPKDEDAYKNAYGLKLSELIAECLWGVNGKYMVLIVADPMARCVSTHAVNATADEARDLMLTAAGPYIGIGSGEPQVMQ